MGSCVWILQKSQLDERSKESDTNVYLSGNSMVCFVCLGFLFLFFVFRARSGWSFQPIPQLFMSLLLSVVCREQNISSLVGMRRRGVGGTLSAVTTHREDSHRSYSGSTSVSPVFYWCVKCVPPSKEICTLYLIREKSVKTVFGIFCNS